MNEPDPSRRLRRIFPSLTTCTECGDRGEHDRAGSRGEKVFRRCPRCRAVYAVLPIGEERDDGGLVSNLVIW